MIYLVVIIGIFCCSISHIFLKKSALDYHKSKVYEILNLRVILSYLVFFITMNINIWAMSKGLNLKDIALLESLGYVFVPMLSYIVFKENLSLKTIISIVIIFIGIIIFYL